MQAREFYHLRRDAFDGSVDPADVALTAGEQAALALLEEGLASGAAVLLLTGEPGLGKTTLARVLAARAVREGVRPVFVHHPRLGFDDLVDLICADLKLPQSQGATAFGRLRVLQAALVRALERGRRVLVILDEAQETPDDTLENLRLLATLEAGPHARPLQILLVGQPELEARLRERRWRALAQRIGARATLAPLSPAEARAFMGRRLAEADPVAPQEVFTPEALEAAVRASGGAPRRLERLGRAALDSGVVRAERPVRASTVRRVARWLDPAERRGPPIWGQPIWGQPAWAPALAACGVVAAVLVVVAGVHDRQTSVRLARAQRHLAAARQLLAARDATAGPPLRTSLDSGLRTAMALDALPVAPVAAQVAAPPVALRRPVGLRRALR